MHFVCTVGGNDGGRAATVEHRPPLEGLTRLPLLHCKCCFFLSSSKSSLPMNTHINLRTNACTKKHILIVGKFVLAKRDM